MPYTSPAQYPYEDTPSTDTPVRAAALNEMVESLDDLDGTGSRVATLETGIATAEGRLTAAESALDNLPYVSVTDYGATGDGTTDDTTAMQNAINAAIAAKVSLFIPAASVCASHGWDCRFSRHARAAVTELETKLQVLGLIT